MKIVERWDITAQEKRYGVTEVDVSDTGKQLYPHETKAEAKALLELVKIQRRGALNNGKFRDKKYEAILKQNDRI